MNRNKRILWSIAFNFLIIVIGVTGVCVAMFVPSVDSAMYGKSATDAFRYLTIDGSIFCVIAALTALIPLLTGVRYSNFTFFMKFAAAVTGTVIFITVIAMVPSEGRSLIYGLDMICLHIICPALCLISFLLFDERRIEIRKMEILYSVIPLLIYGIVAVTLCINKVWTGDMIPYPFLDVHNNAVWVSVLSIGGIAVGSIVLAYILNALNEHLDKMMDDWN